MAISFHSEGINKPRLPYRKISLWLKNIVSMHDAIPGNLSYIFCNDNYLLDINNRFLKHDFYTDIVSFDYCDKKLISGDFFISTERVLENSVLYEVSFNDELLRVIVHGLLHLLGFSDSTDEEKTKMRSLENECLEIFKELGNGCIE